MRNWSQGIYFSLSSEAKKNQLFNLSVIERNNHLNMSIVFALQCNGTYNENSSRSLRLYCFLGL